MPDNGGSLLRGVLGGYGIGRDLRIQRRRDQLDKELRADRALERVRGMHRFGWEQTDRANSTDDRTRRHGYEDQDRATITDERARRRQLEDEIRGRADAERSAEELGTGDEIETALTRMAGVADTDMSPEEGELEAALRRRRAAVLPAEREREQGEIERRAEARAQEYGDEAALEAELAKLAGVPDADVDPAQGAVEAALRRRQAAMKLRRDTQGMGRETVELDPESGEPLSRRVTRPVGIAPPPVTPPPAAPGGEGLGVNPPSMPGAPDAQQRASSGQAALKPGTVVVQQGKRYQYRGGDPRRADSYEAVD